MNSKLITYIKKNSNLILAGLLILNLVLRLVIFYSTKLFYFSDFVAYFDAIELIHKGEEVSLYIGEFSYLNSYIAYFFKYQMGSIDYYFIFNSLIGTLATFVIYKIVISLNENKIIGLIAVIILTVYTEFMVFSSILYTPVLMVFILAMVILITIKYIEKQRITYFFMLVLLISISLLLKRVLIYAWGIYFIFAILQMFKKNKQLAIHFFALSVVLLISSSIISTNIILKGNDYLNERSFLLFAGHTWYGGDGGKAAIIYPEKQALFDKKLKAYCNKNNIDIPNLIDITRFQNQEVKEFIVNHPISWVRLQFHKFFWEYGVLPESKSFKVLMTGLTNKNTILTALLLVIPIVVIVTLFIFTFNLKKAIRQLLNEPIHLIMALFLAYYLIATVFYYAYAERYRIPVMACFWIPLLARNLYSFRIMKFFKNKKELIIKLLILFLFIGNWTYEAYIIGVKNIERYNKTLDAVKKYKEGNTLKVDFRKDHED